ncbi:MAG TPA: MBL fold metallo-hydrolase [Anaerolineales bacterium]|nr:MBL fold metallo-hydrolase [Anaerolineales bacterium]
MTGNATQAVFESSRGATIHRLPLEVFPNFWAYVYVVQKDACCVLIDAGSGTEQSHEHLLEGLQGANVLPSDLTHILLTHAHIDHYGGLTKLRQITNAKVGVHELDLQTIAHHESRLDFVSARLDSFLTGTGLSDEVREQVIGIYRLTKSLYQSIPVDFTYEAIDMRLEPFEFFHLPGHCPGHVAIRFEDVIFCGDMVVEGVTPHLIPESISPRNGLSHYLESLARLQQWSTGARLILNGHDEPITDLAAQIESTRQNILRRMRRAVQALDVPLTIDEICRAVYGETSGYNQLLVIEKTGAYIEYLYEHGMVELTNPLELEQGLPGRYWRSRDENIVMAELERKVGTYTVTQVHT